MGTITLEIAEKLIKSFKANMSEGNARNQPFKISPNSVISAVCEVFGIKSAEIKGGVETKRSDYSAPFGDVYFENRSPVAVSLRAIFGGRDRSTVIHAVLTK